MTQELASHPVTLTEKLRIADLAIKPGVTTDEGKGDDWPDLRRRIFDHDILVFGTSVWLGQAMQRAWVNVTGGLSASRTPGAAHKCVPLAQPH